MLWIFKDDRAYYLIYADKSELDHAQQLVHQRQIDEGGCGDIRLVECASLAVLRETVSVLEMNP